MTLTAKTESAYRARAAQLINRAEVECNQKPLTARHVAQWLLEQQKTFSKATWRQYRAALVHEWTRGHRTGSNDEADHAQAIDLLKQTPPPEDRPAHRQTSAQKLKKIPEHDMIRLLNHVNDHPSRHGLAILSWLIAGLWTGLRPSEWEHAQLIAPARLQVANAKATQGRAHGSHRIIELTQLTDSEMQIIQFHLDQVQQAKSHPSDEHSSGFEKFYSQCRAGLYEITRALWPTRKRHITLYSARHQFAANAKFNGLSLEQIAALMGHASIDTATMHYGRRSAGQGGIKVDAHHADVERVQQLQQQRQDKKSPGME